MGLVGMPTSSFSGDKSGRMRVRDLFRVVLRSLGVPNLLRTQNLCGGNGGKEAK